MAKHCFTIINRYENLHDLCIGTINLCFLLILASNYQRSKSQCFEVFWAKVFCTVICFLYHHLTNKLIHGPKKVDPFRIGGQTSKVKATVLLHRKTVPHQSWISVSPASLKTYIIYTPIRINLINFGDIRSNVKVTVLPLKKTVSAPYLDLCITCLPKILLQITFKRMKNDPYWF